MFSLLGSIPACKQILLSCGKNMLNMKDNQNQTPLHLATLSGHGEMVDFLLQNGGQRKIET
jgi:inversin